MLCPHCGKGLAAGEVCDCRVGQESPSESGLPSQSYGRQQYQQQQAPREYDSLPYEREPQKEPVPPKPKNGFAIAGLVVAFAAIVLDISLLGVPSILAIVLSAIGLARAKPLGGAGRGIALAGLVIGAVVLIGTIIVYSTCASFTTGSASLSSCYGFNFEYRSAV